MASGHWLHAAGVARVGALALALAACTSVPSGTEAVGAAPESVALRVIAFNDFHGNLRSPGTWRRTPDAAPVAVGGVDALAGYVQSLRAGQSHSIVVAAGDLVGASPLISALFRDEVSIEALNRMGLELSSVGNHEFDAGVDELLRKQGGGCAADSASSCRGREVGTSVPFEGARFQYLAANVFDVARAKPLLPAYAVRSFGGVKVAFIGLTLAGTPSIVSPAGVAGLRFDDEADTVNALVPQLQAQGVHAIVVLIHQGGVQALGERTNPQDINGCAGQLGDELRSPITRIVRRLDDGVDLVISGHTHAAYNCRLPNRTGRLVAVTQASSFGRVVTSADLTLDPTSGRVTALRTTNWLVERDHPGIVPDERLAELVRRYGALAAPLENRGLGRIAAAVPNAPNADGESPAGDLVADAQLAATAPEELGHAQMAFTNPGGVRGAGLVAPVYPHEVTFGESFTLQPFGNSLVVLELSAQEIKDLLEQQFPGCSGQTSLHVLQLSRGLAERWQAAASGCHHIMDVRLTRDGVTETIVAQGAVAGTQSPYRVTVNSYLASGGDGFSVLAHAARARGGAQDVDALAAYLSRFEPPHAPYDPRAAEHAATPRITRIP